MALGDYSWSKLVAGKLLELGDAGRIYFFRLCARMILRANEQSFVGTDNHSFYGHLCVRTDIAIIPPTVTSSP